MEVKITRLERTILDRMKSGWQPFPMQLGRKLFRSLTRKELALVAWDDKGRAVLKLTDQGNKTMSGTDSD